MRQAGVLREALHKRRRAEVHAGHGCSPGRDSTTRQARVKCVQVQSRFDDAQTLVRMWRCKHSTPSPLKLLVCAGQGTLVHSFMQQSKQSLADPVGGLICGRRLHAGGTFTMLCLCLVQHVLRYVLPPDGTRSKTPNQDRRNECHAARSSPQSQSPTCRGAKVA